MIRNISVSLLAFLFLATGAYAQTLTLNPLSTFGVGEIAPSTGARNMSTERYVNRLEQLEEVASSFDGVDKGCQVFS